ncbi:protein-tyrosine phosphatase family protein [Natronomonas sp.]|uniref:protein-tyrosine phosphatase family protein n=1 Tax=Natronomonas sp. TaxID=2184060 RepID=UPI0026081145|nr:dual specificity protein phosphatase family protein [Natronomonas sp.]
MTNLGRIAPSEPVFGVCRPGHLGADLGEWSDALEAAGIGTVVCLLSESEAARYDLPGAYAERFSTAHAPIRDRHLPAPETLAAALSAIRRAEAAGERCALHCNAGLGRTGIVSAAWLCRERGYDPRDAVSTVEAAHRTPREAVRWGNATTEELLALIG